MWKTSHTQPSILPPREALYVPQEIIDLIVENVASDDTRDRTDVTAALCVCSRISHSFRISSYRFLFGEVKILIDDFESRVLGNVRMGRLRELLRVNPTLASYVSTLKICMPRIHRSNVQPEHRPLQDRIRTMFTLQPKSRTSWVLQHLAIHARLTSIEISGRRGYNIAWKRFWSLALDLDLPPLIISIVNSHPHLQTLRLAYMVSIPRSIVERQVTPLEHLSLVKCEFLPSDVGPILPLDLTRSMHSPINFQNMKTIVLHGDYSGSYLTDDFFTSLSTSILAGKSSSGLHFPQLESLSIRWGSSKCELTALGWLLTSRAPLWKHLHVELLTYVNMPRFTPFALPTFSNMVPLRELQISSPLTCVEMAAPRRYDLQRSFREMSTFLIYLVLPPTINTISIHPHVNLEHLELVSRVDGFSGFVSLLNDALRFVEDVLCDHIRFAGLKKLDFRLTIYVADENHCVDLSSGITLSRLRGGTSSLDISVMAQYKVGNL